MSTSNSQRTKQMFQVPLLVHISSTRRHQSFSQQTQVMQDAASCLQISSTLFSDSVQPSLSTRILPGMQTF